MSLGDAWDNITPASVTTLNSKTIVWGSGTYLQTLNKSKHKLAVCTATSGGLIIDHVYLANTAADAWIDVTATAAHLHTNSTTGGELINVYIANPAVMDLCLTKTNDLKKAQWIETVTATGSIEDATDGTTGERSIRLRPNGTSGSGATISYPHLKLGFSKRSLFETKLRIETASSLAFHAGVGADDVTAADSNIRKYNAEVCTTTNNNWFLRSADGSANSTSDTGIAMSTNRVAIVIDHIPTVPRIDMYIDTASAFQKTSNIPTTGTTTDLNLIKHSIKNSTAADRPIHVYGTRLRYSVDDQWI